MTGEPARARRFFRRASPSIVTACLALRNSGSRAGTRLLKFGNVALAKEDTRRVWVWAWLDEARQDLRYAARTPRRSPAFATTAAATLALAIGTNTAMFSVLDAVLLRRLPYRSPEQLAMWWTEDPAQNLREDRSALWDVEQWRSHSRTSLLTGFSVVALVMAAVGIYGLIQYSIATRTREIGLRMAIGAQPGDIFRMVIAEGLMLSLTGLGLGLVGALWLGRVVSSLLSGVTATDPSTFMTVSLLL